MPTIARLYEGIFNPHLHLLLTTTILTTLLDLLLFLFLFDLILIGWILIEMPKNFREYANDILCHNTPGKQKEK